MPPQDEPARLAALDAPDQYELGTDFFTVLMEFKTRLPLSHTIDYLGGKFAIGPGLKPWGPFAPNGGTLFQLDLSNLAEAKKLEDLFPQSPPPPPDDKEDEDDAWRQ